MSDAVRRQSGLPHAVFLRRLASAPSAIAADARLSQGAFLVLRLVDLLADPRPLYAYAHHLEDALRLDEALDVLCTLLSVGGGRLGPSDRVAAQLRIGRVNRKLNRFDDADAAYNVAAELADITGDVYSALLSRVGRAIATQAKGNLAESERLFGGLLLDAQAAGERDIEARAHHALGTTLLLRGQVDEAIVHVCRAFERYEDEASSLRALNDMGVMLLASGRVHEAERALGEVVRLGGARDNVTNAMIELMHCASYRGDRVGFERRRAECESRRGEMPPNILADFYLKAGIGNARFGNFRRAEVLMREASRIAAGHGLHELEFRVERIMAGLRSCEAERTPLQHAAAQPAISTEALQEVSASLARLENRER